MLEEKYTASSKPSQIILYIIAWQLSFGLRRLRSTHLNAIANCFKPIKPIAFGDIEDKSKLSQS